MNTIATFRKCTLSNDELLKKVDQMTDGLFDIKHKSERDRILVRHIPALPNDDYDLLVGELILRFDEIKDALDDAVIGLEWWNKNHKESSSNEDWDRIEKWKVFLNHGQTKD